MTEKETIEKAKDALNALCDYAEDAGVNDTKVDALKAKVRAAFRDESPKAPEPGEPETVVLDMILMILEEDRIVPTLSPWIVAKDEVSSIVPCAVANYKDPACLVNMKNGESFTVRGFYKDIGPKLGLRPVEEWG